jgi:WD40 repeat protein
VFNNISCIWNLHIQLIVADLLKSHFSMVFSVGFRVLSGTKPMVLKSVQCTIPLTFQQNDVAYSVANGKRNWSVSRAAMDMLTDTLVLQGHKDDVCSVSFSPNGKWIVSASDVEKICVWNTYSKLRLQRHLYC